jgi:ribosome-binding factor A
MLISTVTMTLDLKHVKIFTVIGYSYLTRDQTSALHGRVYAHDKSFH